MKKKIVSGLCVLVLGTTGTLVGFTKYKDNKVYSEKDIPLLTSKDEVKKAEYITRNEAVKIGKDILKKSININIDNMDLTEEVTLVNDKWFVKWKSKDEKNNQKMIIDAYTGEIKGYSSGKSPKDIYPSPEELDKSTKKELEDIIEPALNIGQSVKISYDIDSQDFLEE